MAFYRKSVRMGKRSAPKRKAVGGRRKLQGGVVKRRKGDRWFNPYYNADFTAAGAGPSGGMPAVGASRKIPKWSRGVGSSGGASGRSYKRKRSTLHYKRLNTSLLIPSASYRLQGIKQENPDANYDDAATGGGYAGFYPIGKGSSAGTGGMLAPVYVADLTGHANGGSAVAVGAPFVRMSISDLGNATFADSTCQNSAGTTVGAAWQLEDGRQLNTSVNSTQFNKYIQTDYYDLRFKFYGARKQAVTFDVMIVRFKNDFMAHDVTLIPPNYSFQRNQFWQNLARAEMVNTILPRSFDWSSQVRILKRKRIILPARDTDDLSVVPPSVDLKWFIRDRKIRKYVDSANTLTTDVAVDSASWAVSSAQDFSNHPAQRSRTFVIIRATDMNGTKTVDDSDDSPSFDMCIRRRLHFYE